MDSGFLSLAVPVALIIGFFLKRDPKIANRLIPFINFAIAFLAQLLDLVKPAEAGIFSGALGKSVLQMVIDAGLVTVVASGSQSSLKNTWQFARDFFLQSAKAKAAEAILARQAASEKAGSAGLPK